ncbi:hypothetical protein NUSPORA_00411 [Nucleospora cyclopteri]
MICKFHILKQQIVELLEKRPLTCKKSPVFDEEIENNQEELLKCLSIYVQSVINNDINYLEKFLTLAGNKLENPLLDQKRISERKFRIFLKNKMDEFKFIDWDDEENMQKLLEYFYIRAIFDKNSHDKEQEVLKYKNDDFNYTKPIKTINITAEMVDYDKNAILTRKDAFTMKNKPTLSMEKYLEIVEKNAKELLKTEKEVNKNSLKNEERKLKDEFRDENANFRGNLYKQG